MAFVVKDYATAREHDARLKRNTAWEKENDYERFECAMCLHCAFFKIDMDLPIVGECSLKDREGVWEIVNTAAVCNRFISHKGTDINGKRIDTGLLSAIFKIEKLGNSGEIYIMPRSSVA